MKTISLLTIFTGLIFAVCFNCKEENTEVEPMKYTNVEEDIVVIDLEKLQPFHGSLYDSLKLCSEFVAIGKERMELNGWENYKVDRNGNFLIYNVFTQQVYLKDRHGRKLRNIGCQGSRLDKGEYFEMYSASVSVGNSEILVLNPGGQIFRYGYDGLFKNYLDYTKYITGGNVGKICGNIVQDAMYLDDSGDILLHYPWWVGAGRSKYLILDKSDRVVAEKCMLQDFEGNPESGVAMTGFSSYLYDGNVHVVNLSDTVYQIKERKFYPKYVFKQKYPVGKLVDSLGKDVDIFNIGNTPVYEFELVETDQYLIFKYMTINIRPYSYRKTNYGLYDKHQKKSYRLNNGNMTFHTKDSISIMNILFGEENKGEYYLRMKKGDYDSYNVVRIYPQ